MPDFIPFLATESSIQTAEWSDLVIRIANQSSLIERYGKGVFHLMDEEFLLVFSQVAGDGAVLKISGAGEISISNFFLSDLSFTRAGHCIDSLLKRVTTHRKWSGLISLAVLEAKVEMISTELGINALRIPASEGNAHILIAARTLSAMESGRITFSREPICNLSGSGSILYQECLARVFLDDGHGVTFPASFMPSIEHAGMTGNFDIIVMSSIIEQLRLNEDLVLGCNIFSQNAVKHKWWDPILEYLEQNPDIANRLIVEIVENSPAIPARTRDFGLELRSTGCRIAIDDYGVGHSLQIGMELGRSDIVKLDRSLIRNAQTSARGLSRLRNLMGLASDLADIVVIEGVEDRADHDLVLQLNGGWAQGYFYSK